MAQPARAYAAGEKRPASTTAAIFRRHRIRSRPLVKNSGSAALMTKVGSTHMGAGFVNLKGHRKTGGMRASIYNAMPVEGV